MSKIETILERATLLREGREPAQPVHPAPTAAPAEERRPQPQQAPTPDSSVFKGKADLKVSSPYLVSLTDPGSPVMEEYQKLKSVVLKLTNQGDFSNVIMVTSSLSGEGKSITAFNLAVALAQEYDHTVVLVDADLRRPTIETYVGLGDGPGLTDCVVHGADVGQALVKTGIGKLSILPAGSRITNPVELLSSNRMKDFIGEMKRRYPDRYIVIDTPPLLLFAESRVLASMADAILFVVREGHVPLNQVKEALNMLKGDKLLGVVYNDATSYHYDRYHYYSSYAYGKKR